MSRHFALDQPEGWSMLLVLEGTVLINGGTAGEKILRAAELATFSQAGSGVCVEAGGDARLLLLAGEPIAEPVVGHGPFVMNSREEIAQAISDFHSGRFGQV